MKQEVPLSEAADPHTELTDEELNSMNTDGSNSKGKHQKFKKICRMAKI